MNGWALYADRFHDDRVLDLRLSCLGLCNIITVYFHGACRKK
jgi:hypothetical protein